MTTEWSPLHVAVTQRGYFTGVQQLLVEGKQYQFEITRHTQPVADIEEMQAECLLAYAQKVGLFLKRVSCHGQGDNLFFELRQIKAFLAKTGRQIALVDFSKRAESINACALSFLWTRPLDIVVHKWKAPCIENSLRNPAAPAPVRALALLTNVPVELLLRISIAMSPTTADSGLA
jgi:hypothetical protein